MGKLIIGLIGVGTVMIALGVGFDNGTVIIIGVVLFAMGVLIPRLMRGG